jgi:transposase
MTMLAEDYDYVIGGDPDRDTIDLAVLDSATGVRAHLIATTDQTGYAQVLGWANQHSTGRRVWALEGTGSFAAGLATALAQAGEDVVEVGGLRRTRGAKNDRLDAIRAARTALARDHQASPRARGIREAIRALTATRNAVIVSRTKAINELKSLIVVAPEHVRAELRGRTLAKQLAVIEAMTRLGVGPVVAAQLLLSWSHPGRLRSEAAFASLAGVAPLEIASGQRTRHRLNRGGDRALNRALHTVAITRLRSHPESRAYETARRAQGKTHRDVPRCLKRTIARQLYRVMESAARAAIEPTTT